MFMSNFTRSRGSAIKWRPTTNLWCCSIDFFTRHFKSMKALAFIMLFVFSSGSMLGQSNELMERSTYLNRCMDEAPVGPTAAEVGGMYVEICDGITPTVTKSSAWVQPSTDCDWEIIHTYDIVCGDFEEQFKIHYTGGDQTAPTLNEDAVIPSGGSDLNVCFDEIPEGPSESDIRDLFSDNCGDVIVVKSGEPTGSDCAWSVTYKYEITDECGNTASPIDISYSGGDTEDPVLVGVPEDETVSCIDEIPDAPQVTATDNCADNLVVTLEEDDSNLGTFCDGGTLVRTWTVTDECDHTVSMSQTITVEPTPETYFLNTPDNISISCDEAGSYQPSSLAYTNGVDSGACAINGEVAGELSGNYTECGGYLKVTWSYTDECEREITYVQDITVEPAPMAAFESVSDEEITCDEAASYEAGYLAYTNDAETEACLIAGEVAGELSGSYTECGGELMVTWTFMDDCQREITATKTITVLPAPVAEFAPVEDEEITCDEAATYSAGFLTYNNGAETDACYISGKVKGVITGSYTECGGELIATWTYTDDCNRQITASKTITVLPAPVAEFAPVEDEVISCDEAGSYSAGFLTYNNGAETKSCYISGKVEGVITGSYTECGGELEVTWTYIDDCQREITTSKTVTVEPAPMASFESVTDEEITCDEAATYTAGYLSYNNNAETKACSISGEVEGELSGSYSECGGELEVTWTYVDDCQREITATKTVTVLPTPAAEFAPVEDEEITCDEAASYVAGYLSYSNNAETDACLIEGEVEGEISGEYSECGGTLTVTWFYKDNCEREITATKTVTVLPAPVAEFDSVEVIVIDCDEAASYEAGYLAYSNGAGTDACLIAGEVEGEITGSYTECGGLLFANWTFTDECERTITQTQQIKVNPAPAAEFAPVENEEITCDEAASYVAGYLSYSNNAETESCLIEGQVEGELSGNYTECGGELQVTWTFMDDCQREITATKIVTVLPAPKAEFVNVPQNITITCDQAAVYQSANLEYTNNAETEACLITGEVEGEITGSYTECGGEFVVTWTFMDDCQREITATKIVTISPAPVAEFAPVEDEEITCDEAATYSAGFLTYNNGAETDACYISGKVKGSLSGSYTECGGELIATWTYTDDCNRQITASKTITVLPAPVAEFAPVEDEVISCDEAGSYSAGFLTYNNGAETKSCYISGKVEGVITGSYTECGGELEVTWTYIDDCQREITTSKTVTVEPAPMASFESVSDEEITCDEAATYTAGYLSYNNNAETKACSISGEVEGELSGSYTECGGELEVTWTYVDDCQREITASKTVTVLPAPAAEFAPVEDEEITCDEAAYYKPEYLAYTNDAGSDTCLIEGEVLGEISGEYNECGGTLTVTWFYKDNCEREITASKTVTVLPAPAAEFAPVENEEITCDEAASYVAGYLSYSNNAGTEACLISGEVEGELSGTYTECGGELQVTWTFMDDCQREITASKTVTVLPAPAAEFAPVENEEITCDEAASYVAGYLSYSNNAETDACLIAGEVEGEISGEYNECGGELMVTWTFMDDCQREITATKIVTVLPAPAAEFAPVEDEEITCDEAASYVAGYLSYSNNAETDACLIAGEVEGELSGTYTECGGELMVTWTFMDDCQREITATKTVTVLPAPAAEFAPVEDEEITCEEANVYEATYLSYTNDAGTEACLIEGEVLGEISGEYNECGGTLTVTWFYKDDCEREITTSKTVTVLPAPVAEFDQVDDITIACEDLATYEPAYLAYSNGGTVSCEISGEVQGVAEPFDGSCGMFEVNWSFTDECGRTITANRTVTVIDETAPVLVGELPEGISNIDACYADHPTEPTEEEIAALFEDNCGNVNVTKTVVSLGDDCDWAVMFRYEVQDDCGNFAAPVKVYYNGGDKTAPELTGTLPTGETGMELCFDEIPEAPKSSNLAELYTENCSEVIVTELEPVITGDNCYWTATYTYTVEDACGNKAENIVIYYQGGDTTPPVLEGDVPMGQNSLDLCIDSDLGEPSEEDIAALYSDNCSEVITVNKIEKVYGTDCEWIRVFEYIAMDECGNESDIIKVNYQGGDQSPPVFDLECQLESFEIFTSNGADCPAEAGISLNVGDEIDAFTSWTVGGVEILPIGSCVSDNCTDLGDIIIRVIGKTSTDDNCINMLSISFEAEDACGKISEPFTCTYKVIDDEAPEAPADEEFTYECTDDVPEAIDLKAIDACQGEIEGVFSETSDGQTCPETITRTWTYDDGCGNVSVTTHVITVNDVAAPVLECPEDVDFGVVTETPTGFADKAFYTDNCVADGATHDYTDSEITETVNNSSVEGEYIFTFEEGYLLNLGNAPTGTSNGYPHYTGIITSPSGDVLPNYGTILVVYNPNSGEYDILQDFGENNIQPAGTADADAFDGCDAAAWTFTSNTGHNKAFTLECPVYSSSVTYTFTRTFTAADDCGNEDECSVTYTWTIEVGCDEEAPVIECPDDANFGENPDLDNNGVPYGVATTANYTDNMDEDGVTSTYTDELSSEEYYGESTNFDISCIQDGSLFALVHFERTGYAEDGYAIYADGYREDYPQYTYDLYYNHSTNRWEVYEYDNGYLLGLVWYNVTEDTAPSCNPSDWDIDGSVCDGIYVDCGYYYLDYTEYTLTRTFTQTDSCGNEGECSVTYTWVEGTEAENRQSNETTYSTTSNGAQIYAGEVSEERVSEALDFTAYPVPFDKEVNISYTFDFETNVTIELFDTKGLLILSDTNNRYVAGSKGNTRFDLSRTSNQMFYVKLTTSQGSVTKKIVSSSVKRH